MDNKSFILGVDSIPSWFANQCATGRIKVNYTQDGSIIDATIFSTTKLRAVRGDILVYNGKSVTVVPKTDKPKGRAGYVKKVERVDKSEE